MQILCADRGTLWEVLRAPIGCGACGDLIAARLRLQAYSLSLIDGFLLIAWSCAFALFSSDCSASRP